MCSYRPGLATPGSVHKEGDEGEEEEACDCDDASEPLRQRMLGPACHRGQRSDQLTTKHGSNPNLKLAENNQDKLAAAFT